MYIAISCLLNYMKQVLLLELYLPSVLQVLHSALRQNWTCKGNAIWTCKGNVKMQLQHTLQQRASCAVLGGYSHITVNSIVKFAWLRMLQRLRTRGA